MLAPRNVDTALLVTFSGLGAAHGAITGGSKSTLRLRQPTISPIRH